MEEDEVLRFLSRKSLLFLCFSLSLSRSRVRERASERAFQDDNLASVAVRKTHARNPTIATPNCCAREGRKESKALPPHAPPKPKKKGKTKKGGLKKVSNQKRPQNMHV
jgi:hypothetical protein